MEKEKQAFEITCIQCGTHNGLQMYAHRNSVGDMVGWIFACNKCADNVTAQIITLAPIFNAISHRQDSRRNPMTTTIKIRETCPECGGQGVFVVEEGVQSKIDGAIDHCVERIVSRHNAELARLREENERLRKERDDYENREALCCPEDIGFDEYIRHLESKIEALNAEQGESIRARSTRNP